MVQARHLLLYYRRLLLHPLAPSHDEFELRLKALPPPTVLPLTHCVHESTDDRVLYLGDSRTQAVFQGSQRELGAVAAANTGEWDVSTVGGQYNRLCTHIHVWGHGNGVSLCVQTQGKGI